MHESYKNNTEQKRLVLVTHTCNPSYLGGRDQEDHRSKQAWANSSQNPVSGLGEWLKR
jgi:hypothetical protein